VQPPSEGQARELGAAFEASGVGRAQSGCDVEPAIVPSVESADISGVLNGKKGLANPRGGELASLGCVWSESITFQEISQGGASVEPPVSDPFFRCGKFP
jgi:hypothetical protein